MCSHATQRLVMEKCVDMHLSHELVTFLSFHIT